MTIDFVGKSPDYTERTAQPSIDFLAKDALDTTATLCLNRGVLLRVGSKGRNPVN